MTRLLLCAVASYEMILTSKVMDWFAFLSIDLTPIWTRLLVGFLACFPGIAMSLLPRGWREAGDRIKITLTILYIGGLVAH
jgi:hypothetical protein